MLLLAVGAGGADGGDLIVIARGFTDVRGHAVAKLFGEGDDVLGRGRWEQVVVIEDGKASFRFRGLPAGAYALVVFHDANDNGRIDHNLLRLPTEALGFSNGFVPGVLAGMPTFEKLRIVHRAGDAALDINVK
jgi:uncharacterized protein (DUF2141 family)